MKPTDIFGLITLEELDRFEQSIDKSGDCWVYTGSTYSNGYGRVWIGRVRKHVRAHRLAFFLWVDRMPVANVLHSCDNPPCCKPDHLRSGSKQDNVDDMWDRQRAAMGEMLPHTKITNDQVAHIIRMRGEMTGQQLADEFGVKRGHIYRIWSGKRRSRVSA